MNYPENVKAILREYMPENEIEITTPREALDYICQWELGSPYWSWQILSWIKDCYGVDLKEV